MKVLGVIILKIVLLGAPGVGKGTQAKLISESFNIPHISTGDIFRSNISQGTPLGIKANEFMKKGMLVPDELTISIVKDRLNNEDCKNGFLLDGFPRNLFQAKELDSILAESNQYLDKVVLIDVAKDLIIERMAGRRFCTKCGSSYHVKFNPSKLGDKCESCGENLIQRQDDKEDIVLDRLNVYNKSTKPLVDYYSSKGLLYKVQGSKEINEVFESIAVSLKAV
jgi:adenylate kinase